MDERTYTLKLTYKQLWALQQSYEASFTAPDEKGDVERFVSDELNRVVGLAYRREKRNNFS